MYVNITQIYRKYKTCFKYHAYNTVFYLVLDFQLDRDYLNIMLKTSLRCIISLEKDCHFKIREDN